eukprot:TRINITY_DN10319_c0_g1_i3.p1 TRINITY_DN10319_c0_g1~~TRINITY_DN10319_c0_g1_i3.p1  ORF type:complete len:211 (-),score=56.23 TRINITY_DN10319_c0_g1_i3:142-774(-)
MATVIHECPIPTNSHIYKLHEQANASLGNAEIWDAIKLPINVDEDHWIAAQTLGIFDEYVHIILVFEDVCDAASDTCCVMNAGTVRYRWADEKIKAKDVTSVEYMHHLAKYGTKLLKSRELIPADGGPMPRDFRPSVQQVLKRIFRVYAHIYTCHFDTVQEVELEAHLNCVFKRWLFFVREFDLVSLQDMQPMATLVNRFLQQAQGPARR